VNGDPLTNFQGILNQANLGSPGVTNPYWAQMNAPAANTWQDFVVYLCGSAVSAAKVPDALLPAGTIVLHGHGLKNLDPANRVRLRILNWSNSSNTTLYATNIYVSRYDNKTSAELKTEQTVRAAADSAQASSITTLTSTVNGHTSTITQHSNVLNGIAATYTLNLNVNGHVVGLQLANGGAPGTGSVVFLTDRFAIAQPNGTGVLFPFTVGTVNGVPTVGIGGNLVVDGSITARTIAGGAIGAQSVGAAQFSPFQAPIVTASLPSTEAINAVNVRYGFYFAFIAWFEFVPPQTLASIRVTVQVLLSGVWANLLQKTFSIYPYYTGIQRAGDFFTAFIYEHDYSDAVSYSFTPGQVTGVRVLGEVLSTAGLSLSGVNVIPNTTLWLSVDGIGKGISKQTAVIQQ
jgi:hypothetical protein